MGYKYFLTFIFFCAIIYIENKKGMIILVVVIIILTTLLISTVTALVFSIKMIKKLIMDDSTLLQRWLNENTEEEIPCNIIWTFKNNNDFDGSIYDFSMFQEHGIVGITTCCKNKYFFEKNFFDDEGKPIISIFPNQTILLMKDGGYEWDMRPYL